MTYGGGGEILEAILRGTGATLWCPRPNLNPNYMVILREELTYFDEARGQGERNLASGLRPEALIYTYFSASSGDCGPAGSARAPALAARSKRM